MSEGTGIMRCPLCGYEFEASAKSCHSSCAFNESCGIICCPNCGYQIPDERKSRLANTVRRFLARNKQEETVLPPVRPLSTLRGGQSGKVVAVNSINHSRVERLNILGLTTESHVKVEQRNPTFVVRVGFTEISIEREIADDILVEVAP